ncbi:hypothetical protein ACLOJK_017178 [Asimina triloba]
MPHFRTCGHWSAHPRGLPPKTLDPDLTRRCSQSQFALSPSPIFTHPRYSKMTFLPSHRSRLLLQLRLLSTAAAATSASSTSISATRAKSKLKAEHDPDKALAIFSSARITSPVSARYALDLTVRRLAKFRRFSDIESLIEAQKSDPKITHEPFLASLILTYGRAGMLDSALRTFQQMDSLGTPRSAVSFNALLKACNLSRKYDQVPKLFAEVPLKYGIVPDAISYGILVKSLCESGTLESAMLVLKEMEEKEIEITTFTFTSVLDAYYKKGQVEDAERIWSEMGKKGCSLDVVAYNVKLMRTAHHGTPEELKALMDEMASLGLKPDIISYNYLMICYCKNGKMDEAMKVYESLDEKRRWPNATTFRMLVYYLCKNGDFDAGLEVFRASMKRDKIPKFSTTKVLVEGLVTNSKKGDAKVLIHEVKKRFPKIFLDVWEKVEEQLGLTFNSQKTDKSSEVDKN